MVHKGEEMRLVKI